MAKRHKCSACQRGFHTERGVRDHIRDFHKSKKGESVKKPPRADDDEPSMAELFIEAQMNRAMGIRNDDWIEDMLP